MSTDRYDFLPNVKKFLGSATGFFSLSLFGHVLRICIIFKIALFNGSLLQIFTVETAVWWNKESKMENSTFLYQTFLPLYNKPPSLLNSLADHLNSISNMATPVSIIIQTTSLLLSFAIILNRPVLALHDCKFPAIFNLGDSNSDTGGLAATFIAPPPPYGESFFGSPEGRFSDGRLVIDFMAKSFGLPFLNAYLDSLGTNFSHGANFAVSASTITPPQSIIPQGGFSPFYLDVQYWQLMEFKNRSQIIRKRGEIFKHLMPNEEYFSKALYTFDIGQNDLGERFFSNMSIKEVNASVPTIVNSFSTNVKKIYNMGARSFWIHNTGPIGCLPYILANLPAEKDSVGCAKPYNDVAQYFNQKLKEAVLQLRNELPSAAITYVDIYSAKYLLFTHPKKYGFELPLVACCGYGGEYNYGVGDGCGYTATVNGTQIIIGSCKRPSVRVSWDGIHYTEAANKFIFDRISSGAFSDPPIPLKMACHRN